MRAGSSSHVWLCKFLGHQEEKGQTQTHEGRPHSATQQPRLLLSCRLGTALALGICVGINMLLYQRSLRRQGTANKRFTVTVSRLHDKPYKQVYLKVNFPCSKAESCLRQGLGGRAGFHPSVVPVPCSSPCLCCSFPWQQTPNRSCRWGFILLGSSRKPWKPCRAADKFSEAAVCLLKGCEHIPWSSLPPARCVEQTNFCVHFYKDLQAVKPLSGCVLWMRFFVCFAGRHKELLGSLAHLVWYCHTLTFCCSVLAAAETRGVTQQFHLQLLWIVLIWSSFWWNIYLT